MHSDPFSRTIAVDNSPSHPLTDLGAGNYRQEWANTSCGVSEDQVGSAASSVTPTSQDRVLQSAVQKNGGRSKRHGDVNAQRLHRLKYVPCFGARLPTAEPGALDWRIAALDCKWLQSNREVYEIQ
jgi:hypothetical protein